MIILGIETSCDETAAAIVENGTKLISNVVASSQAMHAKYGGIIPDQAAREQLKSILPVIQEALTQNIDAIAVTVGPGLIGSLLVGVETAKALAFAWNKPIIPVTHLIGHVYANWIDSEVSENSDPQNVRRSDNLKIRNSGSPSFPSFPALVLLVSGGHTELILMKGHGKFKLLGSTRDDAAGECFDKCARLLNLGYPGGPAIEAAASKCTMNNVQSTIKLPRPMINDKSFDFSFSGLKTAVLGRQGENPNSLAYELQEAVTDVLVEKTIRAAEDHQVKSVLLAGGVAANSRLREKMLSTMNHELGSTMSLFVPPVSLCTDNAAYIAAAAFFNYQPVSWRKINADPSLDI